MGWPKIEAGNIPVAITIVLLAALILWFYQWWLDMRE